MSRYSRSIISDIRRYVHSRDGVLRITYEPALAPAWHVSVDCVTHGTNVASACYSDAIRETAERLGLRAPNRENE